MFLNILLTVLLVSLAVAVLLAIFIAIRPNTFSVARSTTIAAPPDDVFPHVNDLHKWRAWSPWEEIDPDMERTYVGTAAGVGSKYSWSGDKNVGEGSMTITDSRPNERIHILLEFVRPFKATNEAEFTFVPQGNHTVVTWSMNGTLNFITKGVHLVMSMDKMIGGPFEEGLANLKRISEESARVAVQRGM